jgi:hypothetical protein
MDWDISMILYWCHYSPLKTAASRGSKQTVEETAQVTGSGDEDPVRSAYQPPASSTFLSELTSHQQPAATSQQYSSLRTNQHQPSATSQPNTLEEAATGNRTAQGDDGAASNKEFS